MPARTVGQLSSLLGSYIRASGLGGPDFVASLNQVLERVYTWGIWRDLTFEQTVPVLGQSISLPYDAESVLFYMFDDCPGSRIRPLWDDYKNAGRAVSMGLVDDGFHIGATDLDDETGDYTLTFETADGSTFNGSESFVLSATVAGVRTNLTLNPDSGVSSVATGAVIDALHSVTWSNVASLVRVSVNHSDTDLDVADWAWIHGPEGVLRTRRYRFAAGIDGSTVFRALFKRKHIPVSSDADIVHIGNSNALKHGLLALTAEDFADLEKSAFHWGECRKILDEELGSVNDGQQNSISVQLYPDGSSIQTIL